NPASRGRIHELRVGSVDGNFAYPRIQSGISRRPASSGIDGLVHTGRRPCVNRVAIEKERTYIVNEVQAMPCGASVRRAVNAVSPSSPIIGCGPGRGTRRTIDRHCIGALAGDTVPGPPAIGTRVEVSGVDVNRLTVVTDRDSADLSHTRNRYSAPAVSTIR